MRSLSAIAVCAFLVSAAASFAEDAQLRARAFELVERAQEMSAPKQSAPIVNETVLTFHALGSDGSMREGSYSRVFAGPTGTRQEFSSADFHLVQIDLPDRAAFIGNSRSAARIPRDVEALPDSALASRSRRHHSPDQGDHSQGSAGAVRGVRHGPRSRHLQ